MRKAFSAEMERIGREDTSTLFLTGDLGYKALEGVQEAMGDRFINAGVSEQNMISMAAAVASEGMKVICYSIAPFAVFRPAEQIRLDVCLHNQDVKVVGNGGGYGYGIMGGTHHAIEDIGVLSTFQNMRCYIPFCDEDVPMVIDAMMERVGPAYLRLGNGPKPEDLAIPKYSPIRKLQSGDKLTIVILGPVGLNVFTALEELGQKDVADVFVISEAPIVKLSQALHASIVKTGKLLVVEEHVRRGGIGENLAVLLMDQGVSCQFRHKYAMGYPDGLYGSQKFHQKQNDLDSDSLLKDIKEMTK